MKKKILSIILCGIMVLGLVGCRSNNDINTASKEDSKSELKEEQKEEEKEVSSKTNQEYEEEMSTKKDAQNDLEKYDSEVFYLKDRKITYNVLDGFQTRRKSSSHIGTTEEYIKDRIYLLIEVKPSDLYDDFFKTYEGKEGKNNPAEGYIGQAKMFNSMESESFGDNSANYLEESKIKVSNTEVFYFKYNSNTLGQNGSETKKIKASFVLDEDYIIGIEMWALQSNENADLISIDSVKKIVESTVVEHY